MASQEENPTSTKVESKKCGIVMPISAIDDCNEAHWSDVRSIIYDSVEDAGFEPSLVSEADDVGVIQKRIVQNLYTNPIVVCDVSGKNPNVMLELGMRLAFDKPTIIIKDDKTTYSFDTSPIEHLSYPRDLRFNQITEFKEELSQRIKSTVKAAENDPDYSTFLKHFGTFSVAKLDSKEVSSDELILEEIRELRSSVKRSNMRIRDREERTSLGQGVSLHLKQAIKEWAKEHGVSRKTEIRQRKMEIQHSLERTVGPMHFRSPHDYEEAFGEIFSLLYD